MDCCKAVSLAVRYDGDIWEDFWAHPGVIDFDPLPLGVVVTVAGTGSECNGGAVITNEERKIKTGRDYPALNPRFALMDPTYTFSVPKKQMASGSFDILSHIMEALMRSVIRNLRVAMDSPEDYTARSNLMWDSTMAENRLIKMGKKCDFECHNMEHQLGAYTNCNHGAGLAVIHPILYRHIYKSGAARFARFAQNVWGIAPKSSDEETALAGIDALAAFIKEIGLPTTFAELGIPADTNFRAIADSTNVTAGCCKKLSHDEIYGILCECK